MAAVRKIIQSRRRAPPEGAVLLEDAKKVCEGVLCSPGILVKDIIDRVCMQEDLRIVPIARQFFALCDPKTGLPISPYRVLTPEEAKKKYQLRVIVNTGENSFQFLRMSKTAYGYYYAQVKDEFINDRLYPRASVNSGIWMAAIDMARDAHDNDSDYGDIIRSSKDLLRFMPKYLKDKCTKEHAVEEKLKDTFQRFKDMRQTFVVGHYESKYVMVYEKDMMCGKHIFRLRTNEPASRRKNQTLLAVVSSKEGLIYKVRMGDSNGNKLDVCGISQLYKIDMDTTSIILSIRKQDDPAEQDVEEETATLDFFDKKEAQSFAVIVHAYYQLLVNANDIILTGTLAPQDEFLRVGSNPADGKKTELCHAPIPPQYVFSMLSNHGAADVLSNGNFLIRESRNTDNAYTLSVWYQSKVMNYRITYKEGVGYSFQDPQSDNGEPGPSHQPFPTLVDLISHHSKVPDGLPSLLKMNYTPSITGRIPLLKRHNSPESINSDSLTLPSRVPSSDEDSSNNSTPTTSTPFSLASPHDHFQAAILGNNSMATTTIDSTSSTPQTPSLVEEKDTMPANPFIRDLIGEGVRHIKYDSLKTIKELGSGHYSTVYLAEWSAENCKVAVKIPTMKEHNVEDVKKDLMREILTMSTLNHPHIVRLLGISDTKHYLDFIGVIPVVLMEFVDGGCLRTFLNNFKKTMSADPTAVNKEKTKINFVLYGKQIAEGMNYLAQKKIVHRDLAARNVLLVSNEQVKISDFGLARKQREDSDYYASKGGSNDLPIYWYAPECMATFKFSTKGDVWSYGVTLWEIFTFGDNPNAYLGPVVRPAQSVQMAFRLLADWFRHNNRLSPLNCDKRVYSSILLRCWDLDQHKRPTFEVLAKEMGDLYNMVSAAKTAATSAANVFVPPPQPTTTAAAGMPPHSLSVSGGAILPTATPSLVPAPQHSSNSTSTTTPSSNSAPVNPAVSNHSPSNHQSVAPTRSVPALLARHLHPSAPTPASALLNPVPKTTIMT